MKLLSSVIAATGVVGVFALSVIPASAQNWHGRSMQEMQYRQNGWSSPAWNGSHGGGYYAYGSASGAQGGGYNSFPQTRDAPSPGSSSACVSESTSDSAFPSWMCR